MSSSTSPAPARSGCRSIKPGRLDALTVHAVPRTPPQADQVEVRVRAAGLNFSDVLKTMGVYPGLDGSAPVLGVECVGIVTAVGAGVDSFEIGQRVVALGPGTFGTHVTTLADLVVAIPDDLPDCRSGHGRRRVSHRLAFAVRGRSAGARRTCPHSFGDGRRRTGRDVHRKDDRRPHLRDGRDSRPNVKCCPALGWNTSATRVPWSSRTKSWPPQTAMASTSSSIRCRARRSGQGWTTLAPGGRFIELGKKDVYADASLGLRALANSASFAVVDLDLNLRLQPERYGRFLQQILASHRRRGTAGAPRHRVHPVRRDRRVRSDGCGKPHRQDRHLDTGRRQHRGHRPCAAPAAGSA